MTSQTLSYLEILEYPLGFFGNSWTLVFGLILEVVPILKVCRIKGILDVRNPRSFNLFLPQLPKVHFFIPGMSVYFIDATSKGPQPFRGIQDE